MIEATVTTGNNLFRRYPWLPMVSSCFFFAWMAFTAKVLSGTPSAALWVDRHYPIDEVVFFRSFIMLLVLVPIIAWEGWPDLAPLRPHLRTILLRGFYGTIALFCYFITISKISLSAAVITVNTSPLFAAVFSSLVLKEAIPKRLYWAFPLTFTGVCLAAGHQAALGEDTYQSVGYLFGILSACFSGAAYSMVRMLKDTPASVIVLSLTVVAVVASLPMLARGFLVPTLRDSVWMIAMGTTGGIAQWLMTIGYRYNTAARASSLNLATVGFTVLIAFLALGERMHPFQWFGLALIALGTAACSTSKAE